MLKLLFDTIKMAFAGTGWGIFLALVYGPFCTHFILPQKILRFPFRAFIQILRSVPVLVLALASSFLFGIGVTAGTFALTLYTFSVMTRLFYEDCDKQKSLSEKAFLSALNSGSSRFSAFKRCIVPSVKSGFIENALYVLEANVRHASIFGYVGAGGIGLLLDEKLSWRQYSKAFEIILVLFASVMVLEGLSSLARKSLEGKLDFAFVSQKIKNAVSKIPLLIIFSLFVYSVVSIPLPKISWGGIKLLKNMGDGFLHPDFSLFNFTPYGIPFLLFQTVLIAFLGAFLGCIPALLLALVKRFCHSSLKPFSFLSTFLVCAIRTIPIFVYCVIFIKILGPGFMAGVLAMTWVSTGLLAKRFYIAFCEMDFKPFSALKNSGCGFFASLKYAVFPQFFPRFLKILFYRFDVNLREAAVLGFAGAGGIGAPLIFAMNQYNWSAAASIIISLLAVILFIDTL